MGWLFKKSRLVKEDLYFDTDGTDATQAILKSDGTTRTGSKINASHIPVKTDVRALVDAEDVNAALLDVADKVVNPTTIGLAETLGISTVPKINLNGDVPADVTTQFMGFATKDNPDDQNPTIYYFSKKIHQFNSWRSNGFQLGLAKFYPITRYTGAEGGALEVGGDISCDHIQAHGSSANIMPYGTTAQRPATPTVGMYRMNTTTGAPEWYSEDDSTWKPFSDIGGIVSATEFAASGSGANTMPVGTAAQRPVAPDAGMYRLNSDTGLPEWYDAVEWKGFGACRAWVNFDGATTVPTIRASVNVSSVTRNSTGDYTVNFTTAMPDKNYVVTTGVSRSDTVGAIGQGLTPRLLTTTGFRVKCDYNNNTYVDMANAYCAIFR